MVWNVGRISNIVFLPQKSEFLPIFELHWALQDGEKRKKMFDFRYFNAKLPNEPIDDD